MSIFKKVNRLLFLVFIKKNSKKNYKPFKNHCKHANAGLRYNNAEKNERVKCRKTPGHFWTFLSQGFKNAYVGVVFLTFLSMVVEHFLQ